MYELSLLSITEEGSDGEHQCLLALARRALCEVDLMLRRACSTVSRARLVLYAYLTRSEPVFSVQEQRIHAF